MIFKMFIIKDLKAESFLHPFFQPTKGLAIRYVTEALKDSQTMISKYPSDFAIFEIGEFNQVTGEVLSYDSLVSLGLGSDYLER